MCSVDDLFVSVSDLNGYVVWHIDGFGGVYGGCCVGQRKLDGGMLVGFC